MQELDNIPWPKMTVEQKNAWIAFNVCGDQVTYVSVADAKKLKLPHAGYYVLVSGNHAALPNFFEDISSANFARSIYRAKGNTLQFNMSASVLCEQMYTRIMRVKKSV